jgi:predicted aspartyl protease
VKKVKYILFTLCAVINLSGCSMFHAISLVNGGVTHVRANEETVVPFELSGNLILVKGRINDSGRDYTFMLDTAALTVIGKDVADELGLSEEVGIEMKDSEKGKKDVHLTRLKSFTMGSFKADGISAAVFDLARIRQLTGIKIDGVIGSNFLRFFKVKIDYQKKVVTLSGDTSPLSPVPGASPVRIEQLMEMGFAPQVTVSCGDYTFDALIDTGLKDPLALPPSLMKKLSRETSVEGKGVMVGGAFKDNEKPRLFRVNGIRIASRETGKVVATVTEGQKNALIGYPLLSNYVVIINYPAGEMLLIPTEGGRNVDNVFTIGMGIRRDGTGKTLVSGIWNGSPADRLGIAVGNEIIKVNGRAAGGFTLQELRDQMCDGDSIKTVELLIKNQSGEKSFAIKKEYLFPYPNKPEPKE